MKILLIGVFFWYMSIGTIFATECEQYLQAHNAYSQKEYTQAITLFSQLPQNNFPVLYNLGWSYLKNNELYLALRSFKKALAFCSGACNVQTYMLCKQIQGDLGVPINASRYFDWYYRFNAYFPTLALQLIFLFFFFMAGFVLYASWYSTKKFLFSVILVSTCMSGFIVYDRFCLESKVTFLIKNNNSCMHTGPDHWYTVLTKLGQGMDGYIVSSDGEWHCISCGGRIGWVNAINVDIIS